MKKLYILPLLVAGLNFVACTNEDESIFDQSAAERLEAGQKEYFQSLCADGGLWAMEYFSNIEEPGYLFVLQFESDKSVTFHTDHKWIGNAYKSEKSLWDVINDNGNVLTFNSYNNLFHLFATPENIEGPYAPTDDNNRDIDEEGYGHNGDYEFLLMENDGQNIRLRGKKRALYTYLRKLPSDVNIQEYLNEAKTLRDQFDARRFPTFLMTETATGATYDVTGLSEGVVSVVPNKSTNPFAQTVERPCVITRSGMRPATEFDFVRKDNSHFTCSEFLWASDGALEAPGLRITAPEPATNLLRQDLTWAVQSDSYSDALIAAIEKANEETVEINLSLGDKKVKNLEIGFKVDRVSGKIVFAIAGSIGTRQCIYFGEITSTQGNQVKFALNGSYDAALQMFAPMAPAFIDVLKLFEGEFAVGNIIAMDPSIIEFTGITNPAISFSAKVK